jgi:hypothetical protein
MNSPHLHLVPPPHDEQREDLERLARKGLACAVRRLRARGIDSPELAVALTREAMTGLIEHLHAHPGRPSAFRLLCAAIERLIDRSAGQTGKAN